MAQVTIGKKIVEPTSVDWHQAVLIEQYLNENGREVRIGDSYVNS